MIIRAALKGALALAARVEVAGMARWAAVRGPAVVVANHVSYLDGPLLAALAPRPMLFGITPEFCGGIWRHGLRLLRAGGLGDWVPLGDGIHAPLRRMAEHLLAGGAVCLFPEGGIGGGRGLQPIRAGAAWLAVRAAAWIVPVRVSGAERSRLFGRGHAREWRPRVRVEVRRPFRVTRADRMHNVSVSIQNRLR